MIAALKQVFAGSARFVRVCPFLFAIPFALELAQHWAEIHIGFYDSLAAAKQVEAHPLRMGVGHLKILSLMLMGYWATRFLAFGTAREAVRIDPAAARLYLWVLLWGAFWTLLLQDGPQIARAWGVSERALLRPLLAVFVASLLIDVCLSAWKAAAALGNPGIGFLRSLRMIRGSFWWAQWLLALTIIPLLALHYLLFFVAIGRPPALLWAILVADSLLTAYLGVVGVALTYAIARRMADRHGVPLLPESA